MEIIGQGIQGQISGFEGQVVRVKIPNIPGGTTFKHNEIKKIASIGDGIIRNGPGRPRDSLDNPDTGILKEDPIKGGFICPQCGSQLGSKLSQQGKCPNCGRQMSGSEGWNPFATQPGVMNNNPILRSAQFSTPKEPVMPSNIHVREVQAPEVFTRRTKQIDIASLSDENADKTDEEHIADCCESADDLAIDG